MVYQHRFEEGCRGPALLFQPKYRVRRPENYLISVYKQIFFGTKYRKNALFNFENRSAAEDRRERASCDSVRKCKVLQMRLWMKRNTSFGEATRLTSAKDVNTVGPVIIEFC